MKYSTSPPTSRSSSPFLSDPGLTLPMPITYRQNCIGAATKCYKYMRKLFKYEQMDFEFASWQILFLFVSPQKVYRNFQNRKQTKLQFARDDPAFLVLLACWLFITAIGFAIVLALTFVEFLQLLFYMILVDCIGVGIIIATLFWFVCNRYLRTDKLQDVEWGYAFDIHLNAFFPPLILHFFQLCFCNAVLPTLFSPNSFAARFVGNTFWLVAISYYVYITFLGYTSIGTLRKTHVILATIPISFVIYICSLATGIDVSYMVLTFYRDRVI